MSDMNLMRLGTKDQAGYADDAVGSIGLFEDVDLLSAQLGPRKRKTGGKVRAILVKSTSVSAIKPGSDVKWQAGFAGTQIDGLTGDAAVVAGVVDPYLSEDVVTNDKFWLITDGPAPVLSGGTYSAGASLKSDSTGRAASATAGTSTNFATAIEAATAAGQLKRAFIACRPV